MPTRPSNDNVGQLVPEALSASTICGYIAAPIACSCPLLFNSPLCLLPLLGSCLLRPSPCGCADLVIEKSFAWNEISPSKLLLKKLLDLVRELLANRIVGDRCHERGAVIAFCNLHLQSTLRSGIPFLRLLKPIFDSLIRRHEHESLRLDCRVYCLCLRLTS